MYQQIPPPDVLRAISMLSNLPGEVGEAFLAPLIQDIGWPFQRIEESLNGTDWYRIMYPLTLQQFAQLRWNRKTFLLDEQLLHPSSRGDIRLVIRNQTENVWARIGRDSELCRQSTAWHKSQILSAGSFCAPVTLALTSEGFKVLDGNHRIAALLDSGLTQTIPLEAWLGVPNVDAQLKD